MKKIAIICLFALLAIVPMTALAGEPALLVKMQLLRLLTEHITITGMTEVISDPKAGYMLTQSGRIELDDKTLDMNPEMWRWNGADIPFRIGSKIQPDDKLLLLSTPCMTTQSGDDASMIIGCGPVEYFVPKGGGLYELKTTSSETEITCRVNPTLQADGKVLLHAKLGHNAVIKREPLEGTYLDVGKPIFDTWEQSFKVTIEQDKDYCVLFSDRKNSLVVRLRVSDCKPEKLAEAQPKQPAESERKQEPAPTVSPTASAPNTAQPAPAKQGEHVDGRAEVQRILESPVSFEFANIRLAEILKSVSDSYKLNLALDSRVVSPASQPGVATVGEPSAQREPRFVTDGLVQYITLKNVLLSEALTALLHPLKLAYSIEDGFVWISTPDRIEQEPFTPLDTSQTTPALIAAIDMPRDFEFDKTPLADVLRTMAERANVSIMIDTKNTNAPAIIVNEYNIKAIRFSTALTILLRQHDLAFITNGQDIIVTSADHARDRDLAQLNAVPVQQLLNR